MQKKAHVTVKVKTHKAGGRKPGKISHMIIRPAENGAMSEIHRQPSPTGPGQMFNPSENEPEVNVHPTLAHLKKHVAATMGPAFGGQESPEEEAAEEDTEPEG